MTYKLMKWDKENGGYVEILDKWIKLNTVDVE